MDFKLTLSNQFTKNNLIQMDTNIIYDVIIIGGGPAGLSASIYCIRKGLKTGLITENIGGQVRDTYNIENYIGYRYIEGVELVNKFNDQIKQFEIGIKGNNKVIKITLDKVKKIFTDDGLVYHSKTIIITTGKSYRKLGVKGEKELIGRGVAYCLTCDAPFFKDKKVAVVGGGNSGVEAAIELAKIASSVILIQAIKNLTADKILINKLNDFKNSQVLLDHEVKEITGDKNVTGIILLDHSINKIIEQKLDGIFIEIGLIPNVEFIKGLINLNQQNEIITDCQCNTNIPGIFAAGDVTSIKYKQIIIAAGEGTKAALAAYDYLLNYTGG